MKTARNGFTLVELLMAATIMAILAVGLGAHLRGGISVWRATSKAAEALQRERIALDRMGRDFANAILYDPRPDAYSDQAGALPEPYFNSSEVSWFTVEPPSRGGLPSVRMVTYTCDSVDGVQGLWRTSRTLGEARARAEGVPTLLVPGCDRLSFRYGKLPEEGSGAFRWESQWADAPEALPAIVDVEWRAAGSSGAKRMFMLPASGPAPVTAETG